MGSRSSSKRPRSSRVRGGCCLRLSRKSSRRVTGDDSKRLIGRGN